MTDARAPRSPLQLAKFVAEILERDGTAPIASVFGV